MKCNKAQNLQVCSCTYKPCPRKGVCCQCIAYHNAYGKPPACVFPPDVERTYDRSVARFVAVHGGGR